MPPIPTTKNRAQNMGHEGDKTWLNENTVWIARVENITIFLPNLQNTSKSIHGWLRNKTCQTSLAAVPPSPIHRPSSLCHHVRWGQIPTVKQHLVTTVLASGTVWGSRQAIFFSPVVNSAILEIIFCVSTQLTPTLLFLLLFLQFLVPD